MDVPLHGGLDGQVALVSGANRGMGRVVAESLAKQGATVFAGTRDLDNLPDPGDLIPVQLDVTDDASVEAAVDRVDDEAGHLDVLVNNAGIAPGLGETVADEPLTQFDEVLAINLRGAFHLTQRALPSMLDREGPRVVNVSSGMGSFGEGMDGEAVAYRVSKAGLNVITANLHADFHDAHGLLANSVCPGWVRTDMGGPEATKSPAEGAETTIWLCRFAPDAPSGRFWRDRDVIPW